MVDACEIEHPPQGSDAARVNESDADVIDQLFGDQPLAVPDRVEDLTDRERRGRMQADHAESDL